MSRFLTMLALPLAGLPGTGAPPAEGPVEAVARQGLAAAMDELQSRALLSVERAPVRELFDAYVGTSQHYEVHSTKSRRLAFQFADELDTLVPRLQEILQTTYAPDAPMRVVIHPTDESYNRFGEGFDERSSVTGAFHASEGGTDLVAATDGVGNANLLRMYLAYGAAHQYRARAYPGLRLPIILDEGIAAYLALQLNPVLTSFIWGEFSALRDDDNLQRRWIPLRKLATNDLSDVIALERQNDPLFQLAYLVVFLRYYSQPTQEQSIASFDGYMKQLIAGRGFSEHPIHKLLTEDIDELDLTLRRFNGWNR